MDTPTKEVVFQLIEPKKKMTAVVVTLIGAFLLTILLNSFALAKQFNKIFQLGEGGVHRNILVSFLQVFHLESI